MKDNSESMVTSVLGAPEIDDIISPPTVEEILAAHADWLLEYWTPDYDLWAPYFVHLRPTIVAHFEGWKEAWALGMANEPLEEALRPVYGKPLIQPHVSHMALRNRLIAEKLKDGATPQQIDDWKHSFRLLNEVMASSAKCVYNELCPLWAANRVVTAWEQASEELDTRGPWEAFLTIVRKWFDIIADPVKGERRIRALSLERDFLGDNS